MIETEISTSRCPYCQSVVSYWDKFFPSLKIRQSFVHCSFCKKKISAFWIYKSGKLTGIAAVLAGVSYLFASLFLPFNELLFIFLTLLIAYALFAIYAVKIPLEECNSASIKSIQKERADQEPSLRISKILLGVIGGFAFMAAIIWFGQ